MSDKFVEMTNDKLTFIVDDFLLTTTLKTVLVSELYLALWNNRQINKIELTWEEKVLAVIHYA